MDPGPRGAFNAYEAARTACEAGQPQHALAWLEVALQWDGPCVLEDVSTQPGLYPMRQLDEFKMLRTRYEVRAAGGGEGLVSR